MLGSVQKEWRKQSWSFIPKLRDRPLSPIVLHHTILGRSDGSRKATPREPFLSDVNWSIDVVDLTALSILCPTHGQRTWLADCEWRCAGRSHTSGRIPSSRILGSPEWDEFRGSERSNCFELDTNSRCIAMKSMKLDDPSNDERRTSCERIVIRGGSAVVESQQAWADLERNTRRTHAQRSLKACQTLSAIVRNLIFPMNSCQMVAELVSIRAKRSWLTIPRENDRP
jgi:hypothetical protein